MRPWSSDVVSHSGYITVNKQYNSNLFFWYFPVKNQSVKDSPLVIWLQGGPGSSSLFGLFKELGPFSINKNSDGLIENPYSWHKENSLLFIDNPIGTGFSFTDSDQGYARNQTIITDHLYKFILQFLEIFPELQKVPLYITGESYAGKHLPSFANFIHKKNPTADMKINLKGIAIGNAYIDPESMLDYSAYLYQIGQVDDIQIKKLQHYENETKIELQKGNYIYKRLLPTVFVRNAGHMVPSDQPKIAELMINSFIKDLPF
ncbi:LOW QUALITY PROTEIN: putative serine carboxypeptidase CPVL [Arctopsyche grandis]|uniref:LOW QUALITY PROTEIN: putative serine carboxypeptidase CPVL n=1 Tax=Arctopsyche grandis TaxID=121162 RepID=UPI00406D9A97